MPIVVLTLFHISPCRRQFPILLHLLFIWFLATNPSQATSYRPQAPGLYLPSRPRPSSAQTWPRRQSQQPYPTPQALGYFHGVGPAEATQTFQANIPLQTTGRSVAMGGGDRAWTYDLSPPTQHQRAARTEGTGAETTVSREEDNSSPLFKAWATRNSVSKTNAQTYLESPYGAMVQNNRKRVIQTANLSIGGPEMGPQPDQEQGHVSNSWRSPFEAMPPFKPPPTGYVLPDLYSTEALSRSIGADRPPLVPLLSSFEFSSVDSKPSRNSFDVTDAKAYPIGTPKQQRRKRVTETVDLSVGGYDRNQPKVRAKQYRNDGRWSLLQPSPRLLNSEKAPKSGPFIGFNGKPRRNSVDASAPQVHRSTAYGGAMQDKKRVTGRGGVSLSSYDSISRSKSGRLKRYPRQRQTFQAMPPFRPPPTRTNLPDLFSTNVNGSGMIIGQRLTRPSSASVKSGSGRSPPRRHPDQDNSDHPDGPDHQVGVGEGKEQHRGPPRGDQGHPDPHEFDGRQGPPLAGPNPSGPPLAGPNPSGPQGPQNERLPQTTDGSTSFERMHSPPDPAVQPGARPSVPFDRLTPQVPHIDYEEFPAPGPERLDPTLKYSSPRDVLVEIETRRLRMTYSVNAPPYFTFESLLSQLATYLMPGFCVDLAVTRRDESCEIISHMASLKTDRQQDWLIEIRDTGGKIIWLNQCMPDAMLFIVPGFRVRFTFVSHVQLVPSGTPGEALVPSTPGSEPDPGGTAPFEGLPQEIHQRPVGGHLAQAGLPNGPPLVPQPESPNP